MMEVDEGDAEWSSKRILFALQSESVSSWESIAQLCQTGEIRDYDELFTDGTFYQRILSCLRSAWKAHDHAVLGGVSEDAHENFMYEQERESERHGHRALVDDEEDEATTDGNATHTTQWRRLAAMYTIISRILLIPEFDFQLASKQRGGFDTNFCTQLLTRFEPKFKKASNGPDHRLGGSLTSVTGVGGVAMGSSSAMMAAAVGVSMPPSAAAGNKFAHVPASILSMVGIGVKHVEPDSPLPVELGILRGLLHTIYLKFYTLRPTLRNLMANFMTRFLRASAYPQGMNEILNVYGAIVKGFSVPLHPSHREYLLKYLIPLHQPNQMLNELSPVMSAYHDSLVYVLIQFLEKDAASPSTPNTPSLCETIITRILLGWPNAKAANSPKEVLLLHECEKLLEYCPTASPSSPNGNTSTASTTTSTAAAPSTNTQFHRIISQFLPYVLQCISSYHHRVAERALQLWQNDKFLSLCRDDRANILPILLPGLVNEEKHWNKSVNKMRGIVLGLFRDMDLILFTRVAHQYYLQRAQAKGEPTNFTPAESLQRIDELIATLRPSDAVLQQTAEQKLLETQVRVASHLPQVKYSDFVFGHVLGEGSFSCVRYAKWIRRGELPSSWPEYAVKILNKELIAQQKYEKNVEREIKIMNLLAHENINRLVGLCENSTNTYLVLEYAPKGDLHTHIHKLGSLDTASARFVAAEILRALEEIHRNEIVFVDLKPENVLVHQSGHIKLSDFGSSRFFHEVGRNTDSDRLEGTAEYLAPEILRGDTISPASDLWAFACVLYQMLAGRTPIWTEEIKPKKVSKAKEAQDAADQSKMTAEEKAAHREKQMVEHNNEQKAHLLSKMVAFEAQIEDEDKYPENFDPLAKDLIELIMKPDPAKRIGVKPNVEGSSSSSMSDVSSSGSSGGGVRWLVDWSAIRSHPFFADISWSTLHTLPAPSLAGGGVAPAPDAVWARRKNSIMWAPMPKSFSFGEGASGVMEPIAEDRAKESASNLVGGTQTKSAGASSLRAQLFSNKTGSIAAPRFSSLKEVEGEGEEDDNDMAEGEDEGDEDDEDVEMSSSHDGSTLHARMRAAPLPTASSTSSLPPRVHVSSSRAGGRPLAPVEHRPRLSDEDGNDSEDSDMGVTTAVLPPRPPVRPSIGLRANRPPIASTMAPPHSLHALTEGGMAPPLASTSSTSTPSSIPSSIFSVPRADATAGPTSLGMGMRRMGGSGNSTAAALLSRIMNKPTANPTMPLPNSSPKPSGAADQ